MLELLGEARFRNGTRSRLLPEEQAAEHWIAWDDSAAVCTRRRHRGPSSCSATVQRLTALRVVEGGEGTRLRLDDGRQWRWSGLPATHILPPGTCVRAEFAGDCAMVVLTLSRQLVRRMGAGVAWEVAPPGASLDDANPIVASLIDAVGARCRRGSAFSVSWVRSVAPVIALELLAPHGSAADAPQTPLHLPAWRLKRLDELIEASLDARIPLSRMAAEVGLSVFHFARTFRNTLGLTPQAYVQLRRCEKARALMDEGTLPLAEIALRCGFTSQSHFTTVFRRIEGVTPGRWRRRSATLAAGEAGEAGEADEPQGAAPAALPVPARRRG